jgi:hypothetical protein
MSGLGGLEPPTSPLSGVRKVALAASFSPQQALEPGNEASRQLD